jgi:5'(3')-deoxyribonucleotidase
MYMNYDNGARTCQYFNLQILMNIYTVYIKFAAMSYTCISYASSEDKHEYFHAYFFLYLVHPDDGSDEPKHVEENNM